MVEPLNRDHSALCLACDAMHDGRFAVGGQSVLGAGEWNADELCAAYAKSIISASDQHQISIRQQH